MLRITVGLAIVMAVLAPSLSFAAERNPDVVLSGPLSRGSNPPDQAAIFNKAAAQLLAEEMDVRRHWVAGHRACVVRINAQRQVAWIGCMSFAEARMEMAKKNSFATYFVPDTLLPLYVVIGRVMRSAYGAQMADNIDLASMVEKATRAVAKN